MTTLSKSNAKALRNKRESVEGTSNRQVFDHVLGGEPAARTATPTAAPAPKGAAAAPEALDGVENTSATPKRAGSAFSPATINAAIESKPASKPKTLSPLAKKYMFDALEKAAQPPSPRLKESAPEYYLELTGRANLLRLAESKVGMSNGFMLVVQSTAIAGAVNVYRLLSDLQRQITWQATLDIQRDRKGSRALRGDTVDTDMYLRADEVLRRQLGMVEATSATGHQDGVHREEREPPVGLDPERDPDFVAPPGEYEVLDALVEINAYLSVILRTVLPDPKDREYVNADLGVPFTTRVDGEGDARSYHPIHDAAEAIEVQIGANKTAIEKRRRQAAEAAVKANAALFAMLGAGRMPPNTDEPAF